MFTAENIEFALTWLVAVGSALFSIFLAVKWCGKKILAVKKKAEEICEAIHKNTALAEHHGAIISMVSAELKSNGGMSLRDAINRIEARVINLESKNRISMIDAGVGVFETDSNGLCVYVNRTYSKLAQLTMDACMGNGWVRALPENERDRVRDEWRDAVNEKREFEMTHKIGAISPTQVNTKAYPVLGKDNQLTGWYGVVIPTNIIHKCPLLQAEIE